MNQPRTTTPPPDVTPSPEERWDYLGTGVWVIVVNVYPDAVTYRRWGEPVNALGDSLQARTLDDFRTNFARHELVGGRTPSTETAR